MLGGSTNASVARLVLTLRARERQYHFFAPLLTCTCCSLRSLRRSNSVVLSSGRRQHSHGCMRTKENAKNIGTFCSWVTFAAIRALWERKLIETLTYPTTNPTTFLRPPCRSRRLVLLFLLSLLPSGRKGLRGHRSLQGELTQDQVSLLM